MSQENEETLNSYEIASDKYLATVRKQPADNVQVWLLKAIENLSKNALIFEVGSAGGIEANYLETIGFKVQRSDAAKSFVQYLQSTGVSCLLFNALTDDYPAKYDLIFANAVLLHFTDSEAFDFALKSFHSLKRGGKLALTTKKGLRDSWQTKKLGLPRYENYWSRSGIEQLMTNAGFVIDDLVEAKSERQDTTWLYIICHKPSN